MKVCVLDGHPPEDGRAFETWMHRFVQILQERGHNVNRILLRDRRIKSCLGCWACWVKTPGRCVIEDDMEAVFAEIVSADWLIMASPMIMGYPSALLKKCMDRMVPWVHPYIEIEGGECHHRPRYANAPKVGLLLERSGDTDVEDIDITTDLISRFARNMKTMHQFTRLTSQPVEEVCNAIDHL